MNSPIAQDSAAQSPGQVSHSSLFQRSGENMVENCPKSPCLARELERFYQNDLYDVLGSPVQERSLQEDVIRQAKTELKHHDSAINKHLVKKAVLEEKSKPWRLGSAVSSNIVDSDGCAVNTFQTERAVRKRIRELDEDSKRQDLAIQKHNTKKAALEKGIKRNLDYEPGQPSKKPVFEAAEGHTLVSMPGENRSKRRVNSYAKLLGDERPGDSTGIVAELPGDFSALQEGISETAGSFLELSGRPYGSSSTSFTEEPLGPLPLRPDFFTEELLAPLPLRQVAPVAPLTINSSIPAKAPSHHGRDLVERQGFCRAPASNSPPLINSYESKPSGNQATFGNIVQEPPRQIPDKEIIERDKQPDREYASVGPASSGRSFTHWLLRRRPSSFGSVMNGMFEKFERVAIGGWPARKPRDKRAVPVDDSVKT